MKRVSVVIPCYNYGKYLKKCIESVINQEKSFSEFETEIIVVNDGSTDDTEEIVLNLRKPIKYIRQENRGLSSARNAGLKLATGDYVIFLDADDLLLPNCISSQLEAIEQSGKDIVVCQHLSMLSFHPEGPLFYIENKWPLVIRVPEIHLCHFNIGPVHAYMVKSDMVKKVGYFDEELKACEDYDFWLRCLLNDARIHLNYDVCVIYRKHPYSMSKNFYNQYFHDYIMHKRLFNWLPCIKSIQNEMPLAFLCYASGCLVTATRVVVWNRRISRDLIKLATYALKLSTSNFYTQYYEISIYYLSKIYLCATYLKNFEPFLIEPIERILEKYYGNINKEKALKLEKESYCHEHIISHPPIIYTSRNLSKKILLASDFFLPSLGGCELFTYDFAKHLIEKGYEVHVVTRYLENRVSFNIDGIHIVQFNCFNTIGDNFMGSELSDYLSFVKLNKYHCMFIIGQPDLWLHVVLLENKKPDFPVFVIPIINLDIIDKWRKDRSVLNAVALILKNASKCISLTSTGIDSNFLRNLGIKPVYIPHAIRVDFPRAGFRKRYNLPESIPLLIHVGNFWPCKNQLGLVEVLSNFDGDWNLAFVGGKLPWPKEAEYYESVVRAARHDKRFWFLGLLPPDEVNSGIAESDILLLPSKAECRPLVILQAMAYGIPWIATPESNSVLEDQGGLVCSVSEFPQAIRQILSNDNLKKNLKELGKKWFNKMHTWDVVLPKFLSLIKSI